MLRFLTPLPGFAVMLLTPSLAIAGDLELHVVDQMGKPVADAVVTVKPAAGLPNRPITFPWPLTMVQQNIAFNPHVLIVPVGATVPFPNKDNVRHHIYSYSKPARFNMKLYGQSEVPTYTFRTAGAVALGCNIHDRMSGFIKVVDTPYAAKSGHDGTVRISGMPGGNATVTIWHPMARTPDNEMVMQVALGASGVVSKPVSLTLRGM
ncbi:plastocyanin/azurin family domain protein [Novosphingobium rosa]|uniref:plastocyanin/azurin family domain protein n=1 Tax=Novosphingobium rosa TaxID=76978 RepID=UPI00082F1504|nr:plastocyanin/azurin family domain protein [Novosphingobium rosa]